MSTDWNYVGIGVGGQLAGHAVAWVLSGASINQIVSVPSLVGAGLSITGELLVFLTGNQGLVALLPNAVQVGAVATTRGITTDGWFKDPQIMGAVGSATAKTLYAYS